MQAHKRKVQPVSIDSLLQMRKQLERRLETKQKKDVAKAGQLQVLYYQCEEAIHHAQVEIRIASARRA